jgi:hypothetical protein
LIGCSRYIWRQGVFDCGERWPNRCNTNTEISYSQPLKICFGLQPIKCRGEISSNLSKCQLSLRNDNSIGSFQILDDI